MGYPDEFSPDARRAIEAEKIGAWRRYHKAEHEWDSDSPFDVARNLRTWIMSVFLVYARQAIAVGSQDVWAFDRVRKEAEEALRLLTIEATYKVGEFQFWTDNWFETRRKFEAMTEWHQFEDELLALPESKAGDARGMDGPPTIDEPTPVDLDAFPLGENPFPEGHPASRAFEEATWKAKDKINKFKSELLRTPGSMPAEFLQAALTYRKRWFSVCAFETTLIVGSKETALWYERWIDEKAKFLIADTMGGLRCRPLKAKPDDPPFFTTEELENAENDLTLELMRMVAHYKGIASARVQEVVQLRKAQLDEMIERLERTKPILPDLPPAAFAKINAARERCDALVGKAKLKHADLIRDAQRFSRDEYQRAGELRRQANKVLQDAQNEAAVRLLDAQAGEFISLVGDLFPYQTVEILAATSVRMYGAEDAVRLHVNEWRARWWERKAEEAAKAETANAPLASAAVNEAESEKHNRRNMESKEDAEVPSGPTAKNGERAQTPGEEEALEAIRQAEADNPDLVRKRQKVAADLTAVYGRYHRNSAEAARQEDLLRDARQYANCLDHEMGDLDLPPNPTDADIEGAWDKVRGRLTVRVWDDFVPRHKNYSDLCLGFKEFESALWSEGFPSPGFPSLDDYVRATIRDLATSATTKAGPVPSSGISDIDAENAGEAKAGDYNEVKSTIIELDTTRIRMWMEDEGWTNPTLAKKLNTSERAVSSLRNNGTYHGKDVITKLATLMKCDPSDLYPHETSG
jgi:hypothetical protein